MTKAEQHQKIIQARSGLANALTRVDLVLREAIKPATDRLLTKELLAEIMRAGPES